MWSTAVPIIVIAIIVVCVIWYSTRSPINGMWSGTSKFMEKAGLNTLNALFKDGKLILSISVPEGVSTQIYTYDIEEIDESDDDGSSWIFRPKFLTASVGSPILPGVSMKINIINDSMLITDSGKVYLSLSRE